MTIIGIGVQSALQAILFATDFSRSAERAGRFLTGVARHCSSRILLLHVLDPSAVLHVKDTQKEGGTPRQDAEARLAILATQLNAEQIETEAILRAAHDPVEEILAVSRGRKADLIVIGTRGLGPLRRLTLGSVAQQLIHKAESPAFTVGPQVKAPPLEYRFQRIVCATDFTGEATTAVNFALSFAQSYQAHMYLCHVLPRPDSGNTLDTQELNEKFKTELQRLIPGMARDWCDPECVLDHGYAVDGILLLAKRVRADLIVLGARRLSHWFGGVREGIAYEVIRKADCPVLTVRK